jgi:hypothetical protein
MAENNQQTINEEAGLPDNFVPVDAPPIIPGSPISDGSSKYLTASLPPGYQHDASFVGTGYTSRTPNLSLMPLGIQGNPSSNAAIQSTSQRIVVDAVAAIPPAKPAAPSVGDGLIHGDAIWEIDPAYVWLRDDFQMVNFPATGNILSSQLPWYISAIANDRPDSGPFPNTGNLVFQTNGTSNNVSYLTPPGQSATSQGNVGHWPLLDYPRWKLVWNFSLGRLYGFNQGSNPPIAFSTAQTSLYIGLASEGNNDPPVIGTNPGRPPYFVGIRFDTDTTAPAISDTQFVFEAVVSTTPTVRNNTQGSTFATGIVPAEGVPYRLEMQCTSAGIVQLTLFNGTTSVTATLTVPQWTTGSVSSNYAAQNGIGTVNLLGGGFNPPVNNGSIFTVSGTSTAFDGTHTALGLFADQINFFMAGFFGVTGHVGTVSGNPSLAPWISFGNDTTATPVANSKVLYIDYFGFVWNPGVGGGTGTPSINKSRYF